jgi:hypothetical protein
MTERRYSDAEVAAIFEQAAESTQAGAQHATPAEGMTLAELEAIGREVGIPAESIVRAANSLEQASPPPSRTFLGFPVGVARTVPLERRLSEEEWERLVVDLRETFDARGTVRSEGSLRQWTNGGLQALLEPTATGHRLRLRTTKSDAVGMLGGGLGMFAFAAVMFVAAALRGALDDPGFLLAVGVLAIFGAVMFASSALRLPRWARTRRRQMEEIAARITAATTGE